MQALFQDSELMRAVRTEVVPRLRTYPTARVWVPECGTGEDAISLSILLHEEGLGRALIYATDADPAAVILARASDRVGLSISAGPYEASGGRSSVAEYLMESEGVTAIRPGLLSRVHVAQHDLSTDASFNEFQFVLVGERVASLGDRERRRALRVIDESLCRFGCLAVAREGLAREVPDPGGYADVAPVSRIYKKLR